MIFHVLVKPNSKKNLITLKEDNELHVRIAAPPVDGKANKHLIAYLAEIFKVPKSSVIITKGLYNTHKTVEIIAGDVHIKNILKSIS